MRSQYNINALIIGFFILAISVMFGWVMHEHSLLNEAAQKRDNSMQMFERLTSLKTRWQNSLDIKQKKEFLLSHPSLFHQEKRQKTLYLEYKNLSGNDFDRIVSTLLNSPFLIKKISLSRSEDVGAISVELEE